MLVIVTHAPTMLFFQKCQIIRISVGKGPESHRRCPSTYTHTHTGAYTPGRTHRTGNVTRHSHTQLIIGEFLRALDLSNDRVSMETARDVTRSASFAYLQGSQRESKGRGKGWPMGCDRAPGNVCVIAPVDLELDLWLTFSQVAHFNGLSGGGGAGGAGGAGA